MGILDPQHYLKFSKIQMGVAAELIEKIGFQGSERVLDVGCGDGKITALMHEMTAEAIGVDLCKNMVTFARQIFPHITFYQQDAAEMIFERCFDVITCLSSMHWVRRPLMAFEKMLLALKPQGKAYILTYPQESVYWKPLQQITRDPLFSPYLPSSASVYSAQEYRKMAEKAGFSVLSVELKDQIGTHQTVEELKGYIKGWLPSYIDLPPDLSQAFIEMAAQGQMIQAIDKGDDKIHLPYTSLTMVLQKPDY